jgi:hypothetical protein
MRDVYILLIWKAIEALARPSGRAKSTLLGSKIRIRAAGGGRILV